MAFAFWNSSKPHEQVVAASSISASCAPVGSSGGLSAAGHALNDALVEPFKGYTPRQRPQMPRAPTVGMDTARSSCPSLPAADLGALPENAWIGELVVEALRYDELVQIQIRDIVRSTIAEFMSTEESFRPASESLQRPALSSLHSVECLDDPPKSFGQELTAKEVAEDGSKRVNSFFHELERLSDEHRGRKKAELQPYLKELQRDLRCFNRASPACERISELEELVSQLSSTGRSDRAEKQEDLDSLALSAPRDQGLSATQVVGNSDVSTEAESSERMGTHPARIPSKDCAKLGSRNRALGTANAAGVSVFDPN